MSILVGHAFAMSKPLIVEIEKGVKKNAAFTGNA